MKLFAEDLGTASNEQELPAVASGFRFMSMPSFLFVELSCHYPRNLHHRTR